MRPAKDTLDKLFTAGYTAKGIVYLLIGGFAVATVIGSTRGTNGPKEVVRWIGTNPFGQFLLAAIGLGLLSYALWRWYRAWAGPRDGDGGKKDTVKRIAWAVSGTSYAVLSFFAFKSAFGGGGGGGGKKQDAITWLLQQPWGQIAVGILAVIVAGVGAYQIYRAVTDKHMERVTGLSSDQEDAFRNTGRVGLGARAVVFGIISYFLFRAALLSDPSQFRGISGSLEYLGNQSAGAGLLAAVGTGLLAYGAFMLVRAKYEHA